MDKQCIKCGKIKSESDFYKSQRGCKCKECVLEIGKEYKRNRRSDINFRKTESVKQKERRVRLWMNTLLHDSKRKGVENTLKLEDIEDIFEKQKGICYWFNIPLIPSEKKKHPQQPSLDRLDRNRGYVKDNVVLCCYSANIGRNENDVETWIDFLKKLNLK
jgi:hypothetical protein